MEPGSGAVVTTVRAVGEAGKLLVTQPPGPDLFDRMPAAGPFLSHVP